MNIWFATSSVALAIVFSYAFTCVVRRVAPRFGLEDLPDGHRKLQTNPVSLGGGVATYAALVGTILVMALAAVANFPPGVAIVVDHVPLLLSAGLLCIAGLWDDKWAIRSSHKLILQMAACLPFLVFGQSITAFSLFGFPIHLGWASTPLILFWLIACINSFNLIDGLDGLASTFGIIATATLAILAMISGNHTIAMLSLVVCGTLVGFLFHNLPPARIYLGDSGSLWIGYLVGVVSIQATQTTTEICPIAVPLVLLGLPFFDTFMAIVRRKFSGRRITESDREHIHHCLQDRGLSKRQVLLVLSSLSLVLSLSAVATFVFKTDLIATAVCSVTVLALVMCQVFGHREATMLMSGVRFVASHRWKPAAKNVFAKSGAVRGGLSESADPLIFQLRRVEYAKTVEKLAAARDEASDADEPIIYTLPWVDQDTIPYDDERENRAA